MAFSSCSPSSVAAAQLLPATDTPDTDRSSQSAGNVKIAKGQEKPFSESQCGQDPGTRQIRFGRFRLQHGHVAKREDFRWLRMRQPNCDLHWERYGSNMKDVTSF